MPRQCTCADYDHGEIEPFHGGTRCSACLLWVDRPPEPEGGWPRLVVRVQVPRRATTEEEHSSPARKGYTTMVIAQQDHLDRQCPLVSVERAAVVLDDFRASAYEECVPLDEDGYEDLDYVRARLVKGKGGVWTLDRDLVDIELTVTVLCLPSSD